MGNYYSFIFTLFLNIIFLHVSADTIYVAPNGTGDGNSEISPLGSFSSAIDQLNPGDVMILADGEYKETLTLSNVDGTLLHPITIKAKNICGAFINGDSTRKNAVSITKCEFLILDGLKAGNTTHAVYSIGNCNNIEIKRCAGFNAGYWVARDGGVVQNTFDDNCHIFGIAYSSDILSEDVWAWGTGRYCFLYFQSKNCILRRGVFRPTEPSLGYGYDRCPHSGFNLYDCDNSIAENCIAFETRVHPQSTHNEGNPWGLVQGGMVFDDHTLPSGFNHVYGCFDLDNGQYRTEVPRSNSAVHLMSKWSGEFEDIVIWKNAHDYQFVKTTTGKVVFPKRALIGSPTRVRQNTIVGTNMNHRYMIGELTDIPLWPWPYEDIIKEQMGMDETMTEYVTRMVDGYLSITPINPVKVAGLDFTVDTISFDAGLKDTLLTTLTPDSATNTYIHWLTSDKNIVEVDNKGIVTGIHPGNAFIIATSDDGGYKDTCYVEIQPVSVSGIMLEQDSASVEVDEHIQLIESISPENATNKNVSWLSLNDDIATVDNNGLVSGLSTGNAVIIAETEDGTFSDTCFVHVFSNEVAASSISMDTNHVALAAGEKYQLTISIEPANVTDTSVIWVSTDTSIVTITVSGWVTAVDTGFANIIVSTSNGLSDTCEVDVNAISNGLNNLLQKQVRIYPNPVKGDFIIELMDPSEALIRIFDISGKLAFEKQMHDKKLNVSRGSLSSGLFIVAVNHNESVSIKKLIVL